MRDLSCFDAAAFDIVWHAYSINFVPDARPVLREVARILHPGGLYRGQWWNPFTRTVDSSSWNGQGYLLSHPYAEGVDVTRLNPGWDTWEVNDEDGTLTRVASPMEYNHKLSTIVNTLAELGFVILRLDEAMGETPADANAEPGSWPHYQSVAPPFLTLWARFQPNIGS
jgi:SAM-dependent methyltransferase